ncbi:MAG: L,D-transpeptidase family protein [Alphaproteobacteria bacterium]|jgi:L,D-peptidoglycan transpeptidase YkuD (ErfK/YbiS/YcfS/YnhG family)|nr:L,D-transpeptidase family protein [Alphaproteobacteria bacterium]MDP7182893.1 L,D-transpeptidase family protein [Alphaproteobacteria bacterium]MDP7191561.1 L,D-transpeptidase family protein [Alphaproteobacteria bacterium]HJO88693.1 L,D-transpeptidase family protein [Alphaproteobacteria bacterium]|tara:strand:+ start:1831 stop:2406 length:576 start_codon:yes stop_codon:yes gene_type:complete
MSPTAFWWRQATDGYTPVMDMVVIPDTTGSRTGTLVFSDLRYNCALGRGGVVPDKREGDGTTPAGRFPLRRVFYRPDRLDAPRTILPIRPLKPEDGWCDDPGDPGYNRAVTLPHRGHCETLWREDEAYDVIVVIGHNDAPVCHGMGSAIFLHLATPDYTPTEGCVTVARSDVLDILAAVAPNTGIDIRACE